MGELSCYNTLYKQVRGDNLTNCVTVLHTKRHKGGVGVVLINNTKHCMLRSGFQKCVFVRCVGVVLINNTKHCMLRSGFQKCVFVRCVFLTTTK